MSKGGFKPGFHYSLLGAIHREMKGEEAWPQKPAWEFGAEFHRELFEPHKPAEFSLNGSQKKLMRSMIDRARKDPFLSFVMKKAGPQNIEIYREGVEWLDLIWHGRADVYVPGSMTVDAKTTTATTKAQFEYMAIQFGWDVQAVVYSNIFDVGEHFLFGCKKKHHGPDIVMPMSRIVKKRRFEIRKYLYDARDYFNEVYGGDYHKYFKAHGEI